MIARVGVDKQAHPLCIVAVKWRYIAGGLDVKADVFSVFCHLCQLKIVAPGGVLYAPMACIVGVIAMQNIAPVVAIFGCNGRPLLHIAV